MKRILSLFCLALSAHGCPTCIGRAHESSSPFFTQEFYNTHVKGGSPALVMHQTDAQTETKQEEES
jgi:hypothetical protein